MYYLYLHMIHTPVETVEMSYLVCLMLLHNIFIMIIYMNGKKITEISVSDMVKSTRTIQNPSVVAYYKRKLIL